MLIYVQLIIILAALSLHSLHYFAENREFEFDFGQPKASSTFEHLTLNNSSIGFGNYYPIGEYLNDHCKTGRTNIDVSIATVNHNKIWYTCSVYNLSSFENGLPNDRGSYYLDC